MKFDYIQLAERWRASIKQGQCRQTNLLQFRCTFTKQRATRTRHVHPPPLTFPTVLHITQQLSEKNVYFFVKVSGSIESCTVIKQTNITLQTRTECLIILLFVFVNQKQHSKQPNEKVPAAALFIFFIIQRNRFRIRCFKFAIY